MNAHAENTLSELAAVPALPPEPKAARCHFLSDFLHSMKYHDSWLFMAWIDIRLRYQRTVLGPFWMVLVSFISIVCIALLGSLLFKVRFSNFFPYVASGMVIWSFISMTITESCMVFLNQMGLIKNVNVPLISFCLRMFVRNAIVLAHSLVVIAFILLFFHVPLTPALLLFVPGMLIAGMTALAIGILFGFLCARYRDVLQLVQALIGILAFMTPVMWQPDMLGDKAYLAYFNPLTHYVDLLRMPLLGQVPSLTSYAVTLGISGVLLAAAAWYYQVYRKHLVYWL